MGMMEDKSVIGGKRVFILLVLNIEIFLEFFMAAWLLGKSQNTLTIVEKSRKEKTFSVIWLTKQLIALHVV